MEPSVLGFEPSVRALSVWTLTQRAATYSLSDSQSDYVCLIIVVSDSPLHVIPCTNSVVSCLELSTNK